MQNESVEPLTEVWRTEDRLHTDQATIAGLCDLAGRDPTIRGVIDDLGDGQAGNGSVFVSGTARDSRTPALLKLGARESERDWLVAIDQATADVVPRVFGSGDLRGVGWLVLERCDFKLDRDSAHHVAAVIKSVGRYQQAAASISPKAPSMDSGWLREHLGGARAQACPSDLGEALADLEKSWAFVEAQCGVEPTHGDVHFANVVARGPDGPALLIDPMPLMSAWAWDAAYLEATLAPYQSAVPNGGSGLVHHLAREREALGLPTAHDLGRVEQLVLGWAAAVWWRIAPWRHDNETWRSWVERRVAGLCL